MRMDIYLGRGQDKMAEWKISGETAVFYEARAADIAQFSQLVSILKLMSIHLINLHSGDCGMQQRIRRMPIRWLPSYLQLPMTFVASITMEMALSCAFKIVSIN